MRYVFVDCRFGSGDPELGRALYLESHIPGAAFLDLDVDLSAPPGERGRHPLPDADAFARSASRAGIGEDAFVVAYDDGACGGAARLWWLLRHFGHDAVAVLGGGMAAWHGPLRAGSEAVEPARFEPRPRSGDTIGADELLARLGEPGLVVVDARPAERYRGELEPYDPVAGHIPGALGIPAAATRPVPPELLEAREVVVYCGSGVAACVKLLALHEAGRTDARLYPGSWSEWSRRGLPVATGPQPTGNA